MDLLVINYEGLVFMGEKLVIIFKIWLVRNKFIRLCDENNINVKYILERYKSVFDVGIGKFKDMKGKFIIKDGVRLKFCKVWKVVYIFRLWVEEELDRL